jgi:hypothetical protein
MLHKDYSCWCSVEKILWVVSLKGLSPRRTDWRKTASRNARLEVRSNISTVATWAGEFNSTRSCIINDETFRWIIAGVKLFLFTKYFTCDIFWNQLNLILLWQCDTSGSLDKYWTYAFDNHSEIRRHTTRRMNLQIWELCLRIVAEFIILFSLVYSILLNLLYWDLAIVYFVEALCYKPEVHGFYSRWGYRIFHLN